MDIEALAKFAASDALESGRSLYRRAKLPIGLGRSNLALAFGIFHEVRDIVSDGDTQLKNIPLQRDDYLAAFFAYLYLEALCNGVKHPQFGEETIQPLLTTAEKLREDYYRPKIAANETRLKDAQAEWTRLEQRYDYLITEAPRNPHYTDLLHDEFYPDGWWNPDLADDYEALPKEETGVVNLVRERSLRRLKDKFRQAILIDLQETPVSSAMRMLSCPNVMHHQAELMSSARHDHTYSTNALNAVTAFTQGLKTILEPPVATVHALSPRNNLARRRHSVVS